MSTIATWFFVTFAVLATVALLCRRISRVCEHRSVVAGEKNKQVRRVRVSSMLALAATGLWTAVILATNSVWALAEVGNSWGISGKDLGVCALIIMALIVWTVSVLMIQRVIPVKKR